MQEQWFEKLNFHEKTYHLYLDNTPVMNERCYPAHCVATQELEALPEESVWDGLLTSFNFVNNLKAIPTLSENVVKGTPLDWENGVEDQRSR